jgi:hypothetical protein
MPATKLLPTITTSKSNLILKLENENHHHKRLYSEIVKPTNNKILRHHRLSECIQSVDDSYHHHRLLSDAFHTNDNMDSDDSDKSFDTTISSTNSSTDSKDFKYMTLNNQNVMIEKQGGLFNRRVLTVFTLWYIFSAFTLFTNKNILTTYKGDPTLLGKNKIKNYGKKS